jgi:glycosyltransferase involved in cell wall biosynthesis
MRIGQNPAKFVNTVSKPANITVAVLNYIPYQQGFYAEALDVLKACLNSVHLESKQSFDLMVFDNGSCEEVQDFLLQEFRSHNIQFLILSEKNLGKGGAWNIIFDAAPGEYIAYADSDVLFHADWLNESLQIMHTFPNVGMVTARPFFTKKEFSTQTLEWARKQANVLFEQGKLIPWETFSEFDLSLGQELSAIESEYQNNDIERITLNGVSAVVGGSHWQFLTRKDLIKGFLPFDMARPMGQVKLLDQRMNEAGFLRLMTAQPYADNMSNTLKINTAKPSSEKKLPKKKIGYLILDAPFIKKILLGIHHRIFLFYYDR